MLDDELNEEDLENVTAGFDSRLREIEKELHEGRLNNTLTSEKEAILMAEWNRIQGIEPNTGRRR